MGIGKSQKLIRKPNKIETIDAILAFPIVDSPAAQGETQSHRRDSGALDLANRILRKPL